MINFAQLVARSTLLFKANFAVNLRSVRMSDSRLHSPKLKILDLLSSLMMLCISIWIKRYGKMGY